jgi:hypothetical protein
MVVTALQFETSSMKYSMFRLHPGHLLQSWLMDHLLLGAILTLVVTVPQSKITSTIFRMVPYIVCGMLPSFKDCPGPKQQALSRTRFVCTSEVVCGVLKRPPDPPS